MNKTKICTKCHKRKKLSEFYKSKISKDGNRPACKKCMEIDHKNYRDKNKIENFMLYEVRTGFKEEKNKQDQKTHRREKLKEHYEHKGSGIQHRESRPCKI